MTEWEQIQSGLAPMFQQARAEGLWFHCTYQDIWLSPDELEREQSNGRLRWGAVNWTLRNPDEYERQLTRNVASNQEMLARFHERRYGK